MSRGGCAPAFALLLATACAVPRPAAISAPRLGVDGRVLDEVVKVTCSGEAPRALRCGVDAEYATKTSGDAAAGSHTTVVVYGQRVRELAVESNATMAPLDADDSVPPPDLVATGYFGAAPPIVGGVSVDARSLRFVRVRATLAPEPTEQPRFWLDAPLARHGPFARVFGIDPCELDDHGCVYRIDYVPSPGPLSFGPPAFAVQAPPDWSTTDVAPYSVDVASGTRILAPGGLELALGATDLAVAERPVWRVAWELFAPKWLAYALAVEGTFAGDTVQLVPSLQAVTPSLFYAVPAIGIGVGAPLRFAPDAAGGVRAFASLTVPLPDAIGGYALIGTVAVDYFPAMEAPPAGTVWVGLGL